jgi:hypothetical protein
MARLNGLVTINRRGIYWQLIDVGGPDVLTIAVSNQTPASLKDLLRRATVPGFWPPEGNEYGLWTIDLDVMREHANMALPSSGFPPWVSGKVLVQPSVGGSSSFRHNPGNAGVGPPHPRSSKYRPPRAWIGPIQGHRGGAMRLPKLLLIGYFSEGRAWVRSATVRIR